MSTVTVENLKRSSETASRSLRGVAAAWLNMNGTGTIVARNSLNTASITDLGTGDYRQNFTAAVTAADFSFNATTEPGGGSGDKGPYYRNGATSFFAFGTYNSAGSFVDSSIIGVDVNGDLA